MKYERPKDRPGFTLTWVQWAKDGQIARAIYEPVVRAPAPSALPAPRVEKCGIRRGGIGQQDDLFKA